MEASKQQEMQQPGGQKPQPEQDGPSFEEALERLESIVRRLESGDVPLEEAIELFQEGMELARHCSGKLDAVERRIEMLLEENGAMARKPFVPGEAKGDGDF